MTARPRKSLPDWLLFIIGAALVVQFAGLGAWQASRGLEKRALQPLSSDDAGFSDWASGTSARAYQRLKVVGQFDSEHQILLDPAHVCGIHLNMVVAGPPPGAAAPMDGVTPEEAAGLPSLSGPYTSRHSAFAFLSRFISEAVRENVITVVSRLMSGRRILAGVVASDR